ncbi:retrovirus-related pol polyprotein from transposon TNT 1-94 [Tanacetum coccineum]
MWSGVQVEWSGGQGIARMTIRARKVALKGVRRWREVRFAKVVTRRFNLGCKVTSSLQGGGKVLRCLILGLKGGDKICLGVDLEPDEWIKDSGCSKHMSGNRKLFSTYKAYNGGNVIFGSNLRGNIIGKGQICDNKCRVNFTEHDSEIIKDGKVIGRGIRKKGLYVMKLGNKPKDKICLATIDEYSMLWHRRLGHADMRLIQSLASKELVRNLPKLKFDQHFCDAYKIGKQAHASHKAKNIVSTTRCLELLHMDLFGPSTVRSYRGNLYTLVIVDDYSRLCDGICQKHLDEFEYEHEGVGLNFFLQITNKTKENDGKPYAWDTKLTKDEECESVDSTKYRGKIGSLLYLTASRTDIMFSVCLCPRFQEAPKTSHLEAVEFRRISLTGFRSCTSCDNHDLSRFDNQSIERDRLIGIGFVLDFVEFISFTFSDKEMILVIEAFTVPMMKLRESSFQNIQPRRFLRSGSQSNVGCKKSCQSSKYGSDLGHITSSLIPLSRGSFDVLVGMDRLSKRKFGIVCHGKVVRIPLEGDEILRVHGERTQGVVKTLMNTKVVEFRVDLVPGATPVAKSPYRLARLEMQELSEQLQELQDEVKNWEIVKPITSLTERDQKYEWGAERKEAFQTLKNDLCDASINRM